MSDDEQWAKISREIAELRDEVRQIRGVSDLIADLRTKLADAQQSTQQSLDERFRARTRKTLAAVLIVVLILGGVFILVRRDAADRESTLAEADARACTQLTELQLGLLESFTASRDAAAAGRLGLSGADQQAQVDRLNRLLGVLVQSDCADGLTITVESPVIVDPGDTTSGGDSGPTSTIRIVPDEPDPPPGSTAPPPGPTATATATPPPDDPEPDPPSPGPSPSDPAGDICVGSLVCVDLPSDD